MSKYYLRELWNDIFSSSESAVDSNDGPLEGMSDSQLTAASVDDPRETKLHEKLVWSPGPLYRFKPLLPPRGGIRNIRLLTILPGNDCVIQCEIKHHRLNDCPEYEALSYVWGDPTKTVPIAVGDESLNVTDNLKSALLHLRREFEPRVLWVDAMCIDQSNAGERAQQVGFMRDIYQQASRTVIWLGEASADSALAINTAARLAEETVFAADGSKLKPEVDYKLKAGNYNPKALPEAARVAIQTLVKRPYFTRVWIVQEIAVAKKTTMVCGRSEIGWDTFNRGIEVGIARNEFFQLVDVGFLHENEYLSLAAVLGLGKKHLQRPAAEDLLDLLTRFRYWNSTDPRDKVFALFGLVGEDVSTLPLSPDYVVPVEDVYKRTAMALLTALQNLDILGSSLANVESEIGKRIPTWVPDWSSRDQVGRAFTVNDSDEPTNWTAARNTTTLPEFFDDGSVLGLSGHTIDRILQIGDTLKGLGDKDTGPEPVFEKHSPSDDSVQPHSGDDEGLRQAFKDILEAFKEFGPVLKESSEWLRYTYKICMLLPAQLEVFVKWEQVAHIKQKGKGPTGEEHLAVYWQTLCAGILPDGYEKTEEYFKEWSTSLNSVRRLAKLRINKLPKISQPLALVGYLKSTYEQFSAFGALYTHALYRRMARTEKGYLCLVPATTRVGDSIALFKGGKVPLVVTPARDSFWKLVGEAYVHGIMRGEAFDERACQMMFLV
jgi:hypothetical protein